MYKRQDIGCVYQGYNSDLTRTVFLGQPTERQLEIYNVVHNAQVEALAALKPGACCSEIDAIARGVIEKAGYGQYFGHGLGHGVGLEIHEGPRLSPQDDSILEAGMVVTVEPGIYIPVSYTHLDVYKRQLFAIAEDGCVHTQRQHRS